MARDDAGGEDREWEITLADLDADEEEAVTPGDPDPENVLFFLAGVVFTVVVFVLLVTV